MAEFFTLRELQAEQERRDLLPGAGAPGGFPRSRGGTPRSLLEEPDVQQSIRQGAFTQADVLNTPISTPIKAPPPREVPDIANIDRFGGLSNVPETGRLRTPSFIETARQAGVVFDKPAPRGHALQSFAFDRKNKVAAYEIALEEEFGESVRVKHSETTGAIEYLDPDSNRWTLARPPGKKVLQSLAGDGIVFSQELLAGGVAGLVTGGFPGAVIPAAAAGAALGEMLRLAVGKKRGINQDITLEDTLKRAISVGSLSFIGGIAADKGLTAMKFVWDSVLGRTVIKRSILNKLNLEQDEAFAIQREIRKVSDGFTFSSGQVTGDRLLLRIQAELTRDPRYAREFGDFGDQQQRHLRNFYDKLDEGYNVGDPETAGAAVQGVFKENVNKRAIPMDRAVEQAAATLDATMLKSTLPFERLANDLRPLADAEGQAFQKWAKETAQELSALAGNKEFIPNVNTVTAARKLDREVKSALLPVQQSDRRLIGQQTKPQPEVSPEIQVLRESLGLEPQEAEALRKIFDPNAKFTFSELWDSMQALKRIARISGKGTSSEEPKVGSVKFLLKAMKKDMDTELNTGSLADLYDTYLTRYSAEKIRLDKGAIGKMMRLVDGEFKVADEKVFREVFFKPGAVREAEQFMALTRSRPEGRQAMREAIVDFYDRQVIDPETLRPDPGKHRTFIKQYHESGVLDVYFGKTDAAKFKKIGNAANVLKQTEQLRERALKEINKSLDGELATIDPVEIVDKIWDPAHPARSGKIMRAISGGATRDEADAVRGEVTLRIRDAILKGGKLDPKALNTLLTEKGGRFDTIIGSVFGPEYLNGLRVLNTGLEIASRQAKGPSEAPVSKLALFMVFRVWAGPISRRGKAISAIGVVKKNAAQRTLENIIMDPAAMKTFMQLRGLSINSKRAAKILGQLGGAHLALPDRELEKPRQAVEKGLGFPAGLIREIVTLPPGPPATALQ